MSKSKKVVTPVVEAPVVEAPVVEAPVVEVVLTPGRKAGFEVADTFSGIMYTLSGGAPYNPRVSHTKEAWAKMKKVFGTSGMATHKQLADALSVHFTKVNENHHDFIGYMVRRKAILAVAD